MELQTWICGLVVLASVVPPADALALYDPELCYILDGFLGLYGLIITGMFIKEKFFRGAVKPSEESLYSDLRGQDSGAYAPLVRDAEKGRNRKKDESTYAGLNPRPDGEYKELRYKTDRQRNKNNDQVYQGLSSATRDTYDALQMQPLPSR
ncbi:T-cell surface glycoprotein CD3 zeta chain-like isoform X2 [Mugil cephalus]|uniref:T-cell surface glycoprotein CD3 zeta chain-like isoform X2 n=1 Tax=Mugil cephalus TaxID=48193 RepID=UPI001FB75B87|nr:T-cell surface glycoprotein CD3 zeta chain-like isoform X2 [Mugil cephalus]